MAPSSGHDANRKASPSDSIFEPDAIEEEQLATLRRYDILDTEREEAFDRLTGMAADLLGVECAFVAFLDTDRQWLRSKMGLSQKDAHLAGTLCTRTIQESGLLVVEDAAAEDRAEKDSSAAGTGLRFYAGVPILAPGGDPIGTFSIMDTERKALSEEERGRLRDLGEMASDALERRREAREHEQLARRFEAVLQDPNVVVGVLSPEGTLLELNDAALRYVKESKEEVLGLDLWDTPWWPEEMKGEVREWVEQAAGGEYVDFEADLLGPSESTRSIEGRIRPVLGDKGRVDTLIFSVRDVTERQRQAKELRMLSEGVEQAKEAILITEAEPLGEPGPRIVYINEAFEEMTGWSEEEILGRTPRVLQGPETDREVLDSLREALEAREEWEGETVNYRKDGTPYRVNWNLAPVRDEKGTLEYWVSVQRDVTEERKREEEVRRQKNLLEQAQRLTGAWEVDLRTGKISWTDRVYEIHEVQLGTEIAFEEAIEFYAPEVRPRVREAFERCVQEGEPYDLEVPLITAKGNRRWIRTVGAPAERKDGEVTKVVGAFQDVTERKTEEQRRKQVIRRVTDAIVEVDSDWRFTLVNEQAERLYQLSEEELLGEDFWEVFSGALGTRFEEEYRAVMKTREPTRFEEYYQGLGGWFDVQVYPNGEGGLAFYFEEISDRKERERKLVAAKEEAEQANRLKSVFLANMSHEIRTPLTSILGFARAIAEAVEAAEEPGEVDLGALARFSSLIERSGNRLMGTLTGVLNLSKLEAGEMDLSAGPVDLAAEVREATEEFAPQAEEAGIGLQADVGETPVWARADEGGVQIALRNLISNAIKYTKDGGRVWIRARPGEGAAVAIEVEDTGMGMDPEKTEGLFEPFKQASEGRAREYEGTGLGLALVQRVADAMDGTVEVETEKGEGTCVTVRLPEAEGKK